MKIRCLVLAAVSLGVLAGCSTTDEKTYSTVMEGMSRNVLRYNFGEPLRVEPTANGGETWYYRFSSWQTQPVSSSGTRDDFGEKTSYISAGVDFSKQVMELPVHVSADGFVVPPLPKGKVVKN
jgi:outer membrane protein assembly factor BamE (lipoprotein component of BamABCDE complex)